MKKIILILISCLFLTSCFNNTDFNDTVTYTSLYPIEYATKYLYSDYSKVKSIYPNETDVNTYTLTDKQKQAYSNSEIFVYAGLNQEGIIAKDLLNINNNLKLIDATKGMNINNNPAELWLDPSNYLMLVRNIKETLIDYSTNKYVTVNINEKYDKLKEKISELDVMLYNLGKNGKYNTILISNNLFTYLNKYGIETVSIDPNSDNLDRSYTITKNMINLGEIKYIFTIKGEELNSNITSLIDETKITKIEISLLNNLTNEEFDNGEDYVSLMKKIIEEYKKELYK